MKRLTTTTGAIALTAIGCMQMLGDVADWQGLKGLGLVSHASPAPKVFTAQNGFETFASRFHLHWTDIDGEAHSLAVTPETYRRLHGPYNRRNAYGAAISYAPVLAANPRTRPMLESVHRFALCEDRPLMRELGVDPDGIVGPVTVELIPRGANTAEQRWQLEFITVCNEEEQS